MQETEKYEIIADNSGEGYETYYDAINGSTFPFIAASVNTFVVSWNDAADKKLSVASDAFVIPSNTLFPVAGCFPSSFIFSFSSANSYISTSEPAKNVVSPGFSTFQQ